MQHIRTLIESTSIWTDACVLAFVRTSVRLSVPFTCCIDYSDSKAGFSIALRCEPATVACARLVLPFRLITACVHEKQLVAGGR